jgi:hypothetical protein
VDLGSWIITRLVEVKAFWNNHIHRISDYSAIYILASIKQNSSRQIKNPMKVNRPIYKTTQGNNSQAQKP